MIFVFNYIAFHVGSAIKRIGLPKNAFIDELLHHWIVIFCVYNVVAGLNERKKALLFRY